MNSGWTQKQSPFHRGEQEVQTRLGIRDKVEAIGRLIVRDYFPEQHREFYSLLPFLVVGMTDAQGRPWASILTGPPGFLTSPTVHELHIATQPLFGAPISDQFRAGANIGMLGILPENRRRNRCNGHISQVNSEGITVAIAQTFGNCPQYIQTRDIDVLPDVAHPQAEKKIEQGDRLDAQAQALIQQADTFFIATAYNNEQDSSNPSDTRTNPAFGTDVSHRGGKPGFVRIENDHTVIFPDFSGNLVFNTMGNIVVNPKAGLMFIDYTTRDLLYLTGRAEVVWDGAEVQAFVGAERFIRLYIDEWQRVEASLPLQFTFGEYSPNLQYSGSWEQMDATLAEERGRKNYLDYEVFRVEAESDNISSFYLRRADGQPLQAYEPGQFLPIRLTIPGQSSPVVRVYSLSDSPSQNYYRLSIKREGLASTFLHDTVTVGARIEAMAPSGKFTLDQSSDRPVVLLSAGVGITPMIAMVNSIIAEDIRTSTSEPRPIYFIHGTRNGRLHAFRETVRQLVETHPSVTAHIRYSQPDERDQLGRDYDSEGYVDLELLKQVLPFDDFDFYLCGPQSFMQSLYDGLIAIGIRAERIHYESFGPATVLEQTATPPSNAAGKMASSPVKVRFAKSEIDTEWTPESGTLLELAEANGLSPAFSCRTGLCGVCASRIQCGTVDYTEEPTAQFAEDEVLICCSTPRSLSGEETCSDDMGIVLDI